MSGASEKHLARIGEKTVLQLNAPSNEVTVVFEDDGDTGYFYALAPTASRELELLDALHVYNAEDSLRGTDVQDMPLSNSAHFTCSKLFAI